MKISKDWILTELAEEYIAVPVGKNASGFSGIIKMNKTGKEIWDKLTQGLSEEKIAETLMEKYQDLNYEKALADVQKMIKELQTEGLLEG